MQVHNPAKEITLKLDDGDMIHIPSGPKWFNPEQAAKLRSSHVFKSAVISGRLIADGEFVGKKPATKQGNKKIEGKPKQKKK